MSEYHEPVNELSQEAREYHRAIKSMMEELEAVDWYHQRVECCADPHLRKILAHNRDEEIEHACMTLEWLRRNMPGWEENLKEYLWTEGDVTEIEHGEEGGKGDASAGKKLGGSLNIGGLKQGAQSTP